MSLLRRCHPLCGPRAAALALSLALAACSSTGNGEQEDSVAWLVRHGRYQEAVELAARERERRPDDERAVEEHRLASTAWLMERGRRLCFQGRHEEALETFRQARELAPESPVVQDWIDTTRERLAERWLTVGLERHNSEDLQGAVEAYETSLGYRPDHATTREMLARALLQQNYRSGMGEDYYDDGIRALDRYFLHEARSLFSYVLKYEPENERAELRGEQADELLASERAAVAASLEAEGLFAAARNEYRLALLLDPTLEAAQRGLERSAREEQAAELLREAERLRLKGRFDEAEAALVEAATLTERQAEAIEQSRGDVRLSRLERQYEQARTLESDWRYEEAVEAYARLLEQEPFFRDAIARKDTLESYVLEARDLYARFEQAASDEERLSLLRQIAVFWPEYRDVRRRLAELEARLPDGR